MTKGMKELMTGAVLIIASLFAFTLAGCGGSSSYSSGGGGGVTSGPGAFNLTSPANLATSVSTLPLLSWSASTEATGYSVQLKLSSDSVFGTLASVTTTSYQTVTALTENTSYDWKVVATNAYGSATAGPWSFTTVNPPLVQLVTCSGAGTTTDVTIQDFFFSPVNTAIAVNAIVKWTNNGSTTHTVTSTTVPANGSFVSGNLFAGSSVCFKFTAAGTYNYHCSIHTSMTGSIVVGP